MIMTQSKLTRRGLLLIAFLVAGALLWTGGAKNTDIYSAISKNLTVLGQIYKEVSLRYVDTVDAGRLLRAGVEGMLNTLDPYTVYVEEEDQDLLLILTHGKYGGVGMGLNIRNGVVTVVDPPFPGTPAAKAGIREGDQLIEVDGASTEELGLSKTSHRIRGKIGTPVTLLIRREGEEELLKFTFIREQINIEDVRYADIIGDNIGYIRLTRFSKNAGSDVAKAVQRLKTRGMKGLILDLRSNPGGMLEAAVEVSDLFLPRNSVIVSTRGRKETSAQEFKALNDPLYGEGPLAILVDGMSASASEIVAGAIQDHDRGIILGDTTFGKGLVQTVVPLSPTSALKVTTAKYYTPSGRCIQKHHYSAWSDSVVDVDVADYRTDRGRPVRGGGGVVPDIAITPPTTSDLVMTLYRTSWFFNFAVNYANTHAVLDSNFQVDDALLQEFHQYLEDKGFAYALPIEKSLSALKKEASEEGYSSFLVPDIDRLTVSLDRTKEEMFRRSQEDIRRILRRELASKFFGTKKEIETILGDDPVVQKAFSILVDANHYTKLLAQQDM